MHDEKPAAARSRIRSVLNASGAVVLLALCVAGAWRSWQVSTQPWWLTAPLSVWGVTTAAFGLILAKRPRLRAHGRLIALVGLAYYVSVLREVDLPVVFAPAFAASYLWVGILGHLAMSWARPFVGVRTALALTVLSYAAAIGTQSLRLWADGEAVPREPWWDEQSGRASTTAESIGTTSLAVLTAGIFTVVLWRWLRSRRSRRRVTLPAWAYVVVVVALGFTTTVSSWSPLSTVDRLAFTAASLCLVQVAVIVIPTLQRRRGWQMLRQLLADPGTSVPVTSQPLGQSVHAAGLLGLESILRQVMGDPGLRLYLTDGDALRDAHGRRLAPPEPEPGRIDWPVHWQGRKVAVVRVDEAWETSDPTIALALNTVGIAVEALRLESLASQQAAEIAQSRQRLVTTALDERRRIERDLHDGVQQMLFAVLTMLDNAEHHLIEQHDPGTTRDILRRAHDRLSGAIAEMRRLTRGLYPATLERHGLAVAVEELRDACPVPTVMTISSAGWGRSVEATAYFVIAESMTNATKHAAATAITISVSEEHGTAVIVVQDNGTGRIRTEPAGGLQHLRDRVVALGGDLVISGIAGQGSTVTARLPLGQADNALRKS